MSAPDSAVAPSHHRLTHMSLKGLARLRGVQTDIEWVRACDGVRALSSSQLGSFVMACRITDTVPTCPKCAVMRDEALEVQEVAR